MPDDGCTCHGKQWQLLRANALTDDEALDSSAPYTIVIISSSDDDYEGSDAEDTRDYEYSREALAYSEGSEDSDDSSELYSSLSSNSDDSDRSFGYEDYSELYDGSFSDTDEELSFLNEYAEKSDHTIDTDEEREDTASDYDGDSEESEDSDGGFRCRSFGPYSSDDDEKPPPSKRVRQQAKPSI